MKTRVIILFIVLGSFADFAFSATRYHNNTRYNVQFVLDRIWCPDITQYLDANTSTVDYGQACSFRKITASYLGDDGAWHDADEKAGGHWTITQTVTLSETTNRETGEVKMTLKVDGGV